MMIDRRTMIVGGGAGLIGGGVALAQAMADLKLPGGPSLRPLTPRFPQKGPMIVQRVRPPLLETPFEVFDRGVFTPNDRFYVRWHYPGIPLDIDPSRHRVAIQGAVKRPLTLSLDEVLRSGEHVEVAAVNQCAGNSRGYFEPRIQGSQWGNGAMGNALWRGVRLRDVLDRAGLTGAARFVRLSGMETPAVEGAPRFAKALPLDKARDDDTILAFAMNGAALPVLNGFPLRLVVPGWFGTYWVKMVSDIEVLTGEDNSHFMKNTYRWPTVPVKPGDKDFPTVPITAMGPRSFITSHDSASLIPPGGRVELRGIACGGDCGVAQVQVVGGPDGAGRYFDVSAILGPDEGQYSFRRWTAALDGYRGTIANIGVRCTNAKGLAQPDIASWNPSGYARNVVERLTLVAS